MREGSRVQLPSRACETHVADLRLSILQGLTLGTMKHHRAVHNGSSSTFARILEVCPSIQEIELGCMDIRMEVMP